MGRHLILLLLVFLAMPVGLARAATKVSNAEHHFTYELPFGWTPFSEADLSDLNKETGLTYLTGARLPGYEYLVVGVIPRPAGPIGEAQLPQFQAEIERAGPKVVTISFDPHRNAVVAHLDLSGPKSQMHAMSYYFIGKKEIVNMVCFAPELMIIGATPTFDRIADTFHFDSGADAASGESRTWMWVLGAVGGLVCVGFAIIIGLGILFVVLKKRKTTAG